VNRDEYARMFQLEERHWWFLARRELLVRALHRFLSRGPTGDAAARLLDVGCGTGGTLLRMAAFGDAYGVDVEPLALQWCRERGLRKLSLAAASALPFRDNHFTAVVALDVLEHIAQDALAVREMARVLAPDGTLLISVPAYASLWSPHDDALMHRRRYAAGQIRCLIAAVPELRLVHLTHVVTALLPLAAVLRRCQQTRRRPGDTPRADIRLPWPWINGLLYRWHAVEADLAIRRRLPAGLSLFAVARKRSP
jgi:SAM-dependent methyltransferase